MLKKHLLFAILLIFIANALNAQSNLFLDDSFTIEEMVADFFDTPNITTSNITYTGSAEAIAFFDAAETDLGIGAGILISSGVVETIAEENQDFANNSSTYLGTPGDNDITALDGSNMPTNDAAIIEFDFTVLNSDSLNFNYVFGSEEYPEFVCSGFNDAFAFFVSGPGIDGPYSNNAVNISTIPGSETVVAIDNVNDIEGCGDSNNEMYYVNNMVSDHINFDGLTVSLPASFYGIGGETYHAKIVIADVADAIYDSGVFLSFEGLGSNNLLVPKTEFLLSQTGNSVNFENLTKYARSWNWDFGNGQISTERNPGTVYYSEAGTYTVSLVTENFCCTNTYTTEIEITEVAQQLVVETTTTPMSCPFANDATIELTIEGGTPPYTTIWTPEIPDFNNVAAGVYNYAITDPNEFNASGTIIIENIEAPDISFTVIDEVAGQSNGSIAVSISNGVPPFQYQWSNQATDPFIDGLDAGNYSVTITDGNGCQYVDLLTVNAQAPEISVIVTTTEPTCFGYDDGGVDFQISGGTAPYEISTIPEILNGNVPAGIYEYTITDINGVTIEGNFTMEQPAPIEISIFTTSATDTDQNGSATAIVNSGGILPFEFLWSNNATTPTIENISAGEYSVTITDANGCENIMSTVVPSVTNVTNLTDHSFLHLFPNPVVDHLLIENNSNRQLKQLDLFNSFGQSKNVDFTIQNNLIRIDRLDEFSQGVYTITLNWMGGEISTLRFVKS